jgi:hypothetical protein
MYGVGLLTFQHKGKIGESPFSSRKIVSAICVYLRINSCGVFDTVSMDIVGPIVPSTKGENTFWIIQDAGRIGP